MRSLLVAESDWYRKRCPLYHERINTNDSSQLQRLCKGERESWPFDQCQTCPMRTEYKLRDKERLKPEKAGQRCFNFNHEAPGCQTCQERGTGSRKPCYQPHKGSKPERKVKTHKKRGRTLTRERDYQNWESSMNPKKYKRLYVIQADSQDDQNTQRVKARRDAPGLTQES